MSLEFLMGYFSILSQIEAASTSYWPEPILLHIEECIDFKSGSGASSSRAEDQFEAEECIDFKSRSGASSSRGEGPVQVGEQINLKPKIASISSRGAKPVQVEECVVASRPEPTLSLENC
jgi:hypothetical protein